MVFISIYLVNVLSTHCAAGTVLGTKKQTNPSQIPWNLNLNGVVQVGNKTK